MTGPYWKSKRWMPILGLMMFGLFWEGCRSVQPVYQLVPASSDTREAYWYIPKIGEWLELKMSIGMPPPPILVRVSDDGTIALPEIGTITVTNKTITELEKELPALYRKYYRNFYVRIIPLGRVYFVVGEVRSPGPRVYMGETTVLTAIQAAGDFTEAANKRNIKLIRPDAPEVVVDLRKVVLPANDPTVHPGDRIEVPRKWWR